MIRINLLKHMPAPTERLQAMLNPSRSGGFISRRETILGGLFLLLAFTILGTQLWLAQEPQEEPPVEEVSDRPASAYPQFKMGAGAANPFEGKKPSDAGSQPARLDSTPTAPKSAPPAAQSAPEPVVAKTAPKPAAEPQSPAAPKGDEAFSGKITGVRVTAVEDGVDLFLPVQGRPRVRTFRVDNPNRVVFDIPGAVLEAPREQTSQSVESAWVSRVRAAQNSIEPPLVRVVLEVPEFPSIQHSASDAGVAIRVRRP